MDMNSLKIIGLSQGEIKVYATILSIGIASINKIHEKTGFERRAIYDIINKLIEKGLITYMLEKGIKTYKCAPPNKLKEKLDEKQKELNEFSKLLPQIKKTYDDSKPEVNFEIYRGKEGMKTVFEDMLSYKKMYAIGGGGYIADIMPIFWKHYNERRVKKGIEWFSLAIEKIRKHPITKEKLIYTKFLPKEFSSSPAVVLIYGNKVVNLSWTDKFFAFTIESKEIAENYKKYHEYLWKNVAKK